MLNQIDNDPLLRLKADEVQIRAREEQRKRDADEEKSNIDRLRLIQNKDIAEQKLDLDTEKLNFEGKKLEQKDEMDKEKLQSQEDQANLRAEVALQGQKRQKK